MRRTFSDWQRLRLRLIAVTETRGMKATLARDAEVTPQAVYEWLSGKSDPAADAALFLEKWVTEEEGKQKAPVVRQHNRSRKTQSRKTSLHENRRSGPKS